MVSNVAQSPVTSQTVLPVVGSAVSSANAVGSPASPLVSTQATTNTTPVTVLPGSIMSTMNKVRSHCSSQLVNFFSSSIHILYPFLLVSFLSFLQARRGVKRQADTTTPSSGQPSPSSATPSVPQPLIPQRRESTRQVKRPKMDLPGETTYPISVSGCGCTCEREGNVD